MQQGLNFNPNPTQPSSLSITSEIPAITRESDHAITHTPFSLTLVSLITARPLGCVKNRMILGAPLKKRKSFSSCNKLRKCLVRKANYIWFFIRSQPIARQFKYCKAAIWLSYVKRKEKRPHFFKRQKLKMCSDWQRLNILYLKSRKRKIEKYNTRGDKSAWKFLLTLDRNRMMNFKTV